MIKGEKSKLHSDRTIPWLGLGLGLAIAQISVDSRRASCFDRADERVGVRVVLHHNLKCERRRRGRAVVVPPPTQRRARGDVHGVSVRRPSPTASKQGTDCEGCAALVRL